MAERFEEAGNGLEALSIALKNLNTSGGGDSAANNKKLAALSAFIYDLTSTYNDFARWFIEKHNIDITIDGINVNLVDLFAKYINPIRAVSFNKVEYLKSMAIVIFLFL